MTLLCETVLLNPQPHRQQGDADFAIRWQVEDYSATAEVWLAIRVGQRVDAWNADANEPQAIESAQGPAMRVSVKWDGCANWDLSPMGCMYHTCSALDVRLLGALMAHLRQRALDLIPNADLEERDA